MPRGGNLIDLAGRTFGRWSVLGYSHNTGRATFWLCRCECGTVRKVNSVGLRKGGSQSCGCFQREDLGKRATRHGMSRSPMYAAWRSMVKRCHDPKSDEFHRYGARGISVCDRWRNSFPAFHEDMGDRPSPRHSVDRVDNDGNYEPGNCRWATMAEQGSNRRNTRTLTHGGVTKTFSEWARETGLSCSTIKYRTERRWPTEDVLYFPRHGGHHK